MYTNSQSTKNRVAYEKYKSNSFKISLKICVTYYVLITYVYFYLLRKKSFNEVIKRCRR